jgi:hypothetical protein
MKKVFILLVALSSFALAQRIFDGKTIYWEQPKYTVNKNRRFLANYASMTESTVLISVKTLWSEAENSRNI